MPMCEDGCCNEDNCNEAKQLPETEDVRATRTHLVGLTLLVDGADSGEVARAVLGAAALLGTSPKLGNVRVHRLLVEEDADW